MNSRNKRKGLSRRQFSSGFAASCGAAAAFPAPGVLGQAKLRVVVIGGGVSGATAARGLKLLTGDAVDIAVITGKRPYNAPFAIHAFAATGGCATEAIDLPKAFSGMDLRAVSADAVAIDRDGKSVMLSTGNGEQSSIGYDVLIAAPGVELHWKGFGEVTGSTEDPLWTSKATCLGIQAMLKRVGQGGRLAITAPDGPHRCPPAVYERACYAAAWFKRHNPGASVVILDQKDSYPLQAQFEAAYADYYAGLIDWVPRKLHGGIIGVNFNAQEIKTEDEVFRADVLNVIPPQTAAEIILEAALTDNSEYAPVDAASMRSAADENIYVIGDSASVGEMSKSAHAAQVQARLACADIILSNLNMKLAKPIEVSDHWWSRLGTDDAIFMSSRYAADGAAFKMTERTASSVDDDDAVRRRNAGTAALWPLQVLQETYAPV